MMTWRAGMGGDGGRLKREDINMLIADSRCCTAETDSIIKQLNNAFFLIIV